MNAEFVRFGVIQPWRHAGLPVVVCSGPLGCRADSVAPVITVREASARPPEIRRSDGFHVIDKLFSNPIDIRNPRVFSDPDPVVNHPAEMLDEMAVDMRANLGPRRLRCDLDFRVCSEGRTQSGEKSGGHTGPGAKQLSTMH